MINQRIFSANVGEPSTGNKGPDAIEQDIDNLLANDQELLGITGDKTTLTTTDKTNLVKAINEVKEQNNFFVDGTKLVGKAKYLQTNDMGATDPNALIESGLYLTNHANNPSNDLYYINVIKHPAASGYISQMAKYVFGTETYTRRKIGGSWTAWEKIITNKQINWITATLQNGWTGTLQYRKNAIGQLEIYLNITPGTIVNNTIIATLPTGYFPKANAPISCLQASTGNSVRGIFVDDDGNIRIYMSEITVGSAYMVADAIPMA